MADIRKLSSGKYQARFVDPSGTRRKAPKPFALKRDAEAFLRGVNAAIVSGTHVDTTRGGITLARWFERWMVNRPAERVKESTKAAQRETWNRLIKPYRIAETPLNQITPFAVNSWMTALAKDGKRPPSVKMAHQLLSSMLGEQGGAVSDQRLVVNPCRVAKCARPQLPEWRYVGWAEIDHLLTFIPDEWHCFVLLAVTTGLRFGELAGLRRGDVNLLRKEIKVEQGISEVGKETFTSTPKSRKTRTVPLAHERTFSLLKAQLEGCGTHPDSFVFTDTIGGHLNRRNWAKRVWTKALENAGLGRIRPHDLRHSCCSLLVEAGVDLKTVQEIMGHASLNTTLLYVHTSDERKRAAMERAFGSRTG